MYGMGKSRITSECVRLKTPYSTSATALQRADTGEWTVAVTSSGVVIGVNDKDYHDQHI